MSYFKEVNIAASDSGSIDAFSRWRTSTPTTLFASAHEYNDSPDFWETVLTGSGTSTHLPNEAAVRLRTTSASGDKVVRQTFRYFRYLPGKSQFIALTAVVGAAASNVVKRLGYYDANNGIFFQQTASAVSVVRRTYVSGAAVDNVVNQSSWNLDKLDGTGPSGYTVDWTKAQIFIIDLQWLGVGRVRLGMDIDGKLIYCHEFRNANNLSTVYMTTANLPLRYEIENTGTASATNDFMQICSTVVSEGGSTSEMATRLRSVSNGATPISVSTRRSILAIRPKATFGGLVNRGLVMPLSVDLMNTGNAAVFVELVRGGTLGGTPSFASVSSASIVEYDIAGTTVTNGEVIWSTFAQASNAGGRISIPFEDLTNADISLTLNAAGGSPISLAIVATSFGAASTLSAAITWREVY